MRHALSLPTVAAFALPLLLSARAEAGPLSAGVQLGSTSSRAEADAGEDASSAYGVYGRLRISPRLSAQLEVGRIDGGPDVSIRQVTALVLVDIAHLGAARRLVPTVLLGLGVDHASIPSYGISADAQRVEAGVGLEYRAEDGLTVGLDLRIGERSVEDQATIQPVYDVGPGGGGPLDPIGGTPSSNSEFRAARVTVGIRF